MSGSSNSRAVRDHSGTKRRGMVGELGLVRGVQPQKAHPIGIGSGHLEQRPHGEVPTGRPVVFERGGETPRGVLENGPVEVVLGVEVPVDDQPRATPASVATSSIDVPSKPARANAGAAARTIEAWRSRRGSRRGGEE